MGTSPLLIKPLQIFYSILTPAEFCWRSDDARLKRAFQLRTPHIGKRERAAWMSTSYRDLSLIISIGLATAFMLWVLWNFHKAGRKP
jgi:hypothetical protein